MSHKQDSLALCCCNCNANAMQFNFNAGAANGRSVKQVASPIVFNIIQPSWFGSSPLGWNPKTPGVLVDTPTGMAGSSVITNGGVSFAYPGATCFDSAVASPWLQIDVATVRPLTSITVYSAGLHSMDGTTSASALTGVDIYVLSSPYSGNGPPPGQPCDPRVVLQPNLPYTSHGCAGSTGQYVLLYRDGANSLSVCRVDVVGPALSSGYCPYNATSSPPILPQGSWNNSCKSFDISRTCVLTANCLALSGARQQSSVDLKTCDSQIANSNGTLKCNGPAVDIQDTICPFSSTSRPEVLPMGTWPASCNMSSAVISPPCMLSASCRASDGKYVKSGVDLLPCGVNAHVLNYNGVLACTSGWRLHSYGGPECLSAHTWKVEVLVQLQQACVIHRVTCCMPSLCKSQIKWRIGRGCILHMWEGQL